MRQSSDREVTAPVAVLVERRTVESAWESHIWRAVSVEIDHLGVQPFRVMRKTTDSTLIRIGNVPMTLHRKEMMGYKVNFANGEPRLYVALQVRDFDIDEPISIDLVTASALEVQAYGHTPESITDNVTMPVEVLDWVRGFMAAQVLEAEVFVKRQRDRAPAVEDYKFGKVALDDVRRDAARRDPALPTHPLLGTGDGRRPRR